MATTESWDATAALLTPEVRGLLARGEREQASGVLSRLRDPEVADVLRALEPGSRVEAFGLLPGDRAADVFDFLDQGAQELLVDALSDEQVAEIFNAMDSDDRVDFLEDAPEEVAASTLALMDPAERAQTEKLLEFPEDSVGRLITTDYLTVRPEWTVHRAMDHIRAEGRDAEMLLTIYVVDDRGRLVDHVRLRNLVLAEPGELCEALREGQVVSLHAEDDREAAVQMMERYDLPVIPVVEAEGVLVGVVTFDDVADVASEETTEDIHKLGGLDALETAYLSTPLTVMARKRGVWLSILFIAGLGTVASMGFFHEQLQARAILALFVPLIIASGGNSGSQAATLIVRALAVGDVKAANWPGVFRRELLSGLMLGSILGLVGLVVATAAAYALPAAEASGLADALTLGFAIGAAVLGVVITGVLVGSMLPLGLVKLGIDPATCSTPFVATIVDIAGLVIYFTVATIVLGV